MQYVLPKQVSAVVAVAVTVVAIAGCSRSAPQESAPAESAPAATAQSDQPEGDQMENPTRRLGDVVDEASVIVSGSIQSRDVVGDLTVADVEVTEVLKGDLSLPESGTISVEFETWRNKTDDRPGLWYLVPATPGGGTSADYVEVDNKSGVPETLRLRRAVIRVLAGLPSTESRPSDEMVLAVYTEADLVVDVVIEPADDYLSAKIVAVNEVFKGDAPLGPIDGPIVVPPPSDEPGGPWQFGHSGDGGGGILYLSGTLDDPTVLNTWSIYDVSPRELKKLLE